ncbi:MAG: FxsA family protein [Myxococcota bacterium]
MFSLALLFITVTCLEIYTLLTVGAALGTLNTLSIIFFTGILGAYLARRQGLHVMFALREELQRGAPPTHLFHGACVLVAGAFLITPGFLTDLMGFSLLLPPVRRILLKQLARWGEKHAQVMFVQQTSHAQQPHVNTYTSFRE